MAGALLQLPTIQNWSCHSSGGCCKQHLVEVTEEERQRILNQNWTEADGIPDGQPVVVKFAGSPWRKRYRLGHQPDGGCVFLNSEGLCRIHAKFGEAAKPLPCLIYPYAFHPAGKRVTVSLRFSCPSVVANLGRPVTDQVKDLKRLVSAVVPAGASKLPAPRISRSSQVGWPDFLRFINALDATLAKRGVAVSVKLRRALFWIGLVEQARFDLVLGDRLVEFLQIVTEAAEGEVPPDGPDLGEPSRVGRQQFRMLVAQYARKDTMVDVESGWRGRWRLLRAAIRFARGTGNVPPLQDLFTEVPFGILEQPFGGLTEESEEIFTRYFRVKVQGIHFCGRAFYDVPFVEGFRSLALIYPSILWLARWLAAGNGRSELETDDVIRAITIADHYHAYSPHFGRRISRRRVRILNQLGDIAKLCEWYSR